MNMNMIWFSTKTKTILRFKENRKHAKAWESSSQVSITILQHLFKSSSTNDVIKQFIVQKCSINSLKNAMRNAPFVPCSLLLIGAFIYEFNLNNKVHLAVIDFIRSYKIIKMKRISWFVISDWMEIVNDLSTLEIITFKWGRKESFVLNHTNGITLAHMICPIWAHLTWELNNAGIPNQIQLWS